jgi:lipopolysaccharide export system permease protein
MGTHLARQAEGTPVKLLSRYIAATHLKILGLCIGAFVAIYLVIDILEKMGRFTRAHAQIEYIALFFLCKVPQIVVEITPLAVLMATLLTLGGLSRTSEITAMRGCGISLPRITSPLLAIAFFISLTTLFANEVVTPESYARMQYIQQVLIDKKNPNTFFRQHNIWYREGDFILQAKLFVPDTQTLKGITLWQMGSGMRPVRRLEAGEGIYRDNKWLLRDVVERDITSGSVVRTLNLPALAVPLGLKVSDLKVLEKDADNIGVLELRRYCDKLQRGGYDPTRYLAQMHSRISLPFASLIMAFLGIPFALRGGRSSGIALGIAVSLGIGFSYFIINSMILSYGQAGALPPLISAWAANFIFAATGVWLAMTINR